MLMWIESAQGCCAECAYKCCCCEAKRCKCPAMCCGCVFCLPCSIFDACCSICRKVCMFLFPWLQLSALTNKDSYKTSNLSKAHVTRDKVGATTWGMIVQRRFWNGTLTMTPMYWDSFNLRDRISDGYNLFPVISAQSTVEIWALAWDCKKVTQGKLWALWETVYTIIYK